VRKVEVSVDGPLPTAFLQHLYDIAGGQRRVPKYPQ
jgi:hypothetical protein